MAQSHSQSASASGSSPGASQPTSAGFAFGAFQAAPSPSNGLPSFLGAPDPGSGPASSPPFGTFQSFSTPQAATNPFAALFGFGTPQSGSAWAWGPQSSSAASTAAYTGFGAYQTMSSPSVSPSNGDGICDLYLTCFQQTALTSWHHNPQLLICLC